MMGLVLCYLSGVFLWTFTEYMLHRFLGHSLHLVRFKTKFYKEHTKHHFVKDYFASAKDKFLTGLVFVPTVFVLSFPFLGTSLATIFSVGFLVGYLIYELIHYRLHIAEAPHSYGAKMRSHHLYHHFVDENMNHGVTTHFWDIVFGTYVKTEAIAVPMKYRLNWFPIKEDGESYQDRYGYVYSLVK